MAHVDVEDHELVVYGALFDRSQGCTDDLRADVDRWELPLPMDLSTVETALLIDPDNSGRR